MGIAKVDELRRQAHSMIEAAEAADSEAAKQRILDSALDMLTRASNIEQVWLEMVAGSEPAGAD